MTWLVDDSRGFLDPKFLTASGDFVFALENQIPNYILNIMISYFLLYFLFTSNYNLILRVLLCKISLTDLNANIVKQTLDESLSIDTIMYLKLQTKQQSHNDTRTDYSHQSYFPIAYLANIIFAFRYCFICYCLD